MGDTASTHPLPVLTKYLLGAGGHNSWMDRMATWRKMTSCKAMLASVIRHHPFSTVCTLLGQTSVLSPHRLEVGRNHRDLDDKLKWWVGSQGGKLIVQKPIETINSLETVIRTSKGSETKSKAIDRRQEHKCLYSVYKPLQSAHVALFAFAVLCVSTVSPAQRLRREWVLSLVLVLLLQQDAKPEIFQKNPAWIYRISGCEFRNRLDSFIYPGLVWFSSCQKDRRAARK